MDHDLNFEECELDDLIGSMDASLEGGATCETGSGVYFDGISGYVDLSDQYMGGSLTFSLLVKAEDVGGTLFDIGQSTYYSSYYTLAGELFAYATWHTHTTLTALGTGARTVLPRMATTTHPETMTTQAF